MANCRFLTSSLSCFHRAPATWSERKTTNSFLLACSSTILFSSSGRTVGGTHRRGLTIRARVILILGGQPRASIRSSVINFHWRPQIEPRELRVVPISTSTRRTFCWIPCNGVDTLTISKSLFLVTIVVVYEIK